MVNVKDNHTNNLIMNNQQKRKELLKEINTTIDAVIKEINSFEKIRLLGVLSNNQLGGLELRGPALPNIIETTIEYAMSIALASENNTELPMPSAEDMISIFIKLESIRAKYREYILLEDDLSKYNSLEQDLRKRVIEGTLSERGEGYQVHEEDIFIQLFNLFKSEFVKFHKFEPESILEILDDLEEFVQSNQKLLKQGHAKFVKWLKTIDEAKLARKYPNPNPFTLSIAYQEETGEEAPFKAIDEQFMLPEEKLTPFQISVLRTLSIKFGENAEFLNPAFKAQPLNDSLVKSIPIVYDDTTKSYYCFSALLIRRHIFEIGENLLKAIDETNFNNIYLGKGPRSRSTFFEEKVATLLKKN